jgi:fatty-acyl-CoA synthase/citronellyl-CoA synthetase
MATIKLNPSLKFDLDDFSRFVVDVLPSYSIPVFIRFRDELELTGPLKIKKTNLRQEAYDINIVKDSLLMWNSKEKKYVTFSPNLHQDLMRDS